MNMVDFSYYCATAVPDADYEGLRVFMDWGNWTFVCDDLFDCGDFRLDEEGTHELMESLLCVFKGETWPRKKHPLIQAHDDLWDRIVARSSEGVAQRYAEAMIKYCRGVVSHLIGDIES
jgi:hypothetical protein